MISFVLQKLLNKRRQRFSSFFESAESRSEMVATFLAMLTLAKAKKISIEGKGEQTDIILLKNKTEAE